ncbi:MAG: spermidine synthase [Candidatus Accumulibacter sp.]|uniref:spermine/spermidine synthase domain-containing protein n=1 Tax=Accumulibacter sp. TaxID=2053492 RepID=UPI0025E400C4|nr:spermidine synthase [Accumulibacter sp.]MCM8593901.1 spermidine synthase [Accumulibacter sp.]MCM8625565.1 spermidine synthase [Accumulibacter sp.]MDS4048042.1 spermidine synthase [Accumulibacter sp.]
MSISERAGVRYLHFSSDWVQGAMRVQRPNDLELRYTREMMAGLLLREAPWPCEALLIGLGAGSLAKFIYRHLPATAITVVEIDPAVESVARAQFHLPDDPLRLRIVIADGADYMLGGGCRQDYILVDGFDHEGRAGVLESFPFYQACRARLSERGLLAINLLGRQSGFMSTVERIRRAFDERVIVFPSCDSGNTIVLATAGEPVDLSGEDLFARAESWRRQTGLNLLPTVARLNREGCLSGGSLKL